MKDNRNIVTLLSLLLTYTLTAIIFIIFLRKRIWDYAITIGFVHLLLTCAVMQAFPTNWKWWIAFLSSVLFMALFGEIAVRCFLEKKTQSASISPQENVITWWSLSVQRESIAGFLLRASNWLFLMAVQVNVTSYVTETRDWNIHQSYPTIFSIFWINTSCPLPTNVMKISIMCYQFENTSYVEEIPLFFT